MKARASSTVPCRACERLNRRDFLASCAACLAGAGSFASLAAEPATNAPPAKRPRVRLVFSHIPPESPTWPNIGFDYETRKKELAAALVRAIPNVEFVPATVHDADQAHALLAKPDRYDGCLVCTVGIWTGAPQVFGGTGTPTIFADDLYGGSGEFLVAYAAARRAGQKVAGVSSSRIETLIDAARAFELLATPGTTADAVVAAAQAAVRKHTKAPGSLRCADDRVQAIAADECLKKLRTARILVVGGGGGEDIKDMFGTTIVPLGFEDMQAAYAKADRKEAARWAAQWTTGAVKTVEPTAKDIEDSAAMYLAQLDLLARHKAQAITVNCLGGFYGGHLTAYPCLGFCQLNDDGLVGACEADVRSTFTMLAIGFLTGRPGYISDPVIDVSKNQIIYAHCVAPTKVFGPRGPANPFHLRSHSEDRKGASIRSLMPPGYMTTSLEIAAASKQMLVHQAVTVENIDNDKACRTKLAAEVKGDIDKLQTMWDQWGWHRVTFYGDLKAPLASFCKAAGLTMVEEA